MSESILLKKFLNKLLLVIGPTGETSSDFPLSPSLLHGMHI